MQKILNNPVVQVILLAVVSYVLSVAGGLLGYPLIVILAKTGNDALEFMAEYASSAGVWIVVFIFWWTVKKYRCLFRALGPEAKGNRLSTSLLIGLVLGLGLNLVLGMIAMLSGAVSLSFHEINIGYIAGFILAVGLQSGSEELVQRVYVYQNLKRIFPKIPAAAIAGNALLFALMHLSNKGIGVLPLLNLFLSGVLFSLVVYYFDSFWGAVAAHTGWNFCQSILLGLPNSGHVSAYSVFRLDAANAYNSFTFDTVFGLEGTAACSILLCLACAAVYLLGRKRNQEPLDVWKEKTPSD